MLPLHPVRFRVPGWAFTWDPVKAADNFKDHGVAFTEAAFCLLDPDGIDGLDGSSPPNEKIVAYSDQSRLLATIYVEVEGEVIRIISARPPTRDERARYERSAKHGGRVLEDRGSGYEWRPNPYAASLERSGINVIAPLPPGARSRESWLNRRTRRPQVG